jgi:hypothetical protein
MAISNSLFRYAGFSLAALLAASIVSGCAVSGQKTTGSVTPAQRITVATVRYDITLPTKVSVFRLNGFTTTTPALDKQLAKDNADALNSLFSTGFKARFPLKAFGNGLVIDNTKKNLPLIDVSITSIETACSVRGCQTNFNLAADLFMPDGKLVWNSSIRTGQGYVEAPIDNLLFDIFANALLDQMKKDGVIAPLGK